MPDPTDHVAAPRRTKPLSKALTPTEVQQFLEGALTNRDRLLILVPLDTGMRLGETAQLRKADLGPTICVLGRVGRSGRSPSPQAL